MQWEGQRESDNVEDRRGMPGGRMIIGGGLGTLVLAIIIALLGGDPSRFFGGGGGSTAPNAGVPGEYRPKSAEEERLARFVRVVLADTEDVWNEQFRRMGKTYREPRLVLFTGHVQSACGTASSAVGPFYCPGDEQVYIDLDFYRELSQRFGAPGDFAQAYVIAHEVGHHVQKLLGITDRVDRMRAGASKSQANAISVRLELQADFLAGVWAHHAQRTKKILEPGDLEEALRAASAIGDDTLQRRATGHVAPDSFTHGTSAQRVYWFRRGFETGDVRQGDTFENPRP